MTDTVRIGLIGCGGMGQHHLRYLTDIPGLRYAAVADAREEVVRQQVDAHGMNGFADGYALIDSGEVDAVLIATPHFEHPPLSQHAFRRGVHVLTEKPVAVTAGAAQQTNDAYAQAKHEHPGLIYAAMFNQRVRPDWRMVKKLITDGRLGPVQRIDWTISDWYRPQAYFDSGRWRATWSGEGGGVLINQCSHNLDLFQWFVGMPRRVTAMVGLGKHHDIEVEDEVVAMTTFDGGAVGTFIASTGEAPGFNRLTIVGDRATLIVDGGKLQLLENDVPVSEFTRTSRDMWGRPDLQKHVLEPDSKDRGHRAIAENFVDAVRDPTVELIAPGVEGIHGLELGNAMLMAGVTGQTVDIPTDRDAFEQLLHDLAGKSVAPV